MADTFDIFLFCNELLPRVIKTAVFHDTVFSSPLYLTLKVICAVIGLWKVSTCFISESDCRSNVTMAWFVQNINSSASSTFSISSLSSNETERQAWVALLLMEKHYQLACGSCKASIYTQFAYMCKQTMYPNLLVTWFKGKRIPCNACRAGILMAWETAVPRCNSMFIGVHYYLPFNYCLLSFFFLTQW